MKFDPLAENADSWDMTVLWILPSHNVLRLYPYVSDSWDKAARLAPFEVHVQVLQCAVLDIPNLGDDFDRDLQPYFPPHIRVEHPEVRIGGHKLGQYRPCNSWQTMEEFRRLLRIIQNVNRRTSLPINPLVSNAQGLTPESEPNNSSLWACWSCSARVIIRGAGGVAERESKGASGIWDAFDFRRCNFLSQILTHFVCLSPTLFSDAESGWTAAGGCPAPLSMPCDRVFDRFFRHRLNFPGLRGCDGSVDIDGKEVTIRQMVSREHGEYCSSFINGKSAPDI